MAEDANEKELTTWGIAGGLRTGFITFMFALLIMCVIYLFIALQQLQNQRYEDMVKFLQPAKDHMNEAAEKASTAADRAISTSDKVDSLTNQLNKPKNLQ
jgi:predicted lipid-binding transport protein (Tim44 family)